MPTHKAVHVASANAPLTLVDVETAPPAPGHVRIAVAACGVCGTDHGFVSGGFPNMTWPLTLGHEIAGTIAELGDGVEDFAVGDRVAVGWFGGNCNRCIPCRKGQFMQCVNGQVPSWHYPGGYAESVTAPATALARIPDELSFAEAAPMGCAGVTTYQRAAPDQGRRRGPGRGAGHRRARPPRSAVGAGDGLRDDRDRARRRQGGQRARTRCPPLHRLDGRRCRRRIAGARRRVGGARDGGQLGRDGRRPSAASAPEGELVIVGVTAEPLPIAPIQLITPGMSVTGHPSGTSRDVEETMHFAVLSGVRAWIEERPLAEAAEAYAAMDEGRARYRMVLTM